MKVSLICPTYNEEKSIDKLIDSMLNQSKKPDEIIFVDSFSKDKTAEIIKKNKSKKIEFIQKKSNISEARNIAIRKAKNSIIACTDAGSILDKDWLKNIIEPFKDKKIDVVSGGYKAISGKRNVEKFISMLTVKPIKKWSEKTFLPSGRSIAFRKSAWKAVGGYPEKSLTGEDTLFALKLKEKGFKFKLARNAMVYWKTRENIKKFAKQFYLYGRGDFRQGNLKKMKLNLLFVLGFWVYLFLMVFFLFFNSLISLILVVLPIIYLLLKGIGYFFRTKKISALFYIPVLLSIKRISYILGASFG
jgi:glycosyltransferase involved in cell wall biosynthesis